MTKCQQKTRQSLKDPARRDLIAGAAGAVGLVVFGGFIGHSTVSEASLVRPPGSRPEAEFLARCIRCDRCRSVCHTNAVGIAHFETGFLAMRTPVMTFHLGHCDFAKMRRSLSHRSHRRLCSRNCAHRHCRSDGILHCPAYWSLH